MPSPFSVEATYSLPEEPRTASGKTSGKATNKPSLKRIPTSVLHSRKIL